MPTVSNIIEIDLSTAIGFKVESHKEVHQWDQGIMLQFSGAEITAGAVCQFDAKSTTYNMIVDTSLGQVAIPNAVLGDDMNGDVKAHLQFTTNDYKIVVYDIHIPVIRRVRPATYISDPDTPGIEEWIAEQVSIIEQDKADIEAMGATASVDANVGTPSVTVTKTGGSGEPVSLDFEFHNLKGVQGEQGIPGPQGPTGPQGPQGPAGPPLPVVTSSDEGKVLTVDDQGDWVADDAPTGLPDVTSSDSGKVLTVDQNGSWVPAPPSGGGGGTATFTGQGAPTSAIAASVGDFYRDTLTDRLYQCSQHIEGTGSTWVEVAAKDQLPATSSSDNGSVLQVINGVWAKGSGGGGGGSSMHTGHGAPTASIVAAIGDIYTDLDTNEAYVCTNYIDPSVTITDLTGKTFYFNETIPEEDVAYVYEKYSETTGQGGYDFSINYINVDRSTNVQYALVFRHNITSVDYYVLVSYSNGTLYETYNGGRWYNANLRRIKFTGGTDATNQDLIDFVTSNAILDNTGSTWAKLVASPLTTAPTYNGSFLQWNTSMNKWQANAGSIFFYTASNNPGTYTRIDPGTGVLVSNGYNIVAQYTTDPRTVEYRLNSSSHYLFRMLLKTLLAPADNGCQSIVNGSDVSSTAYFKAGQYGYVPPTTAANLVNCPTQEGFVLTVIWLNQSYYVMSNESNTKGVRFIITDSGKIYRQYVYNTSRTWYTGEEWKCITNGEVIPDAPTTDGTYTLKCTVTDGTPVYSWVADT